MSQYPSIEDHGIIGNMRTTALICIDGAIDWFCYPRHDSPSVFASILDAEKGGYFQITSAVDQVSQKQFYWPETNVLVTRFLCTCGVGEVIDFMPVGTPEEVPGIVRIVKAIRNEMTFQLRCYPAFNYARDEHETKLTSTGVVFNSPDLSLSLDTNVALQQDQTGVCAEFTLKENETAFFVLRGVDSDAEEAAAGEDNRNQSLQTIEIFDLFDHTIHYWRSWLSQCVYRGRWRGMVERSALALKLMTYEPTGAIIAAPTCSLPEVIGGERNWDYRYAWLRDAAFTVYALMRIGFTQEAAGFIGWIEERCHELNEDGSLQVMYGIDGRHQLPEEMLSHLEGYLGSAPVHIGNGAYSQKQLDIYGELMDSVYLFNKYGTQISYDLWSQLRKLLNWVCDHWHEPDAGVWESRGGTQQHVYSKLMCWVALDRGLRLAHKRSFPADRDRWLATRDEIYEEILAKGWSEEKQAFSQFYQSDSLDAGCLIMPLVFFMAPNDPRMIKTLTAVRRSPDHGGLTSNSLVYRYNPNKAEDGLEGREGTFNLCTFWLVEALTRAGHADPDKLDQARLIFEEMLSHANHLGLYAEETGIDGRALGNFPQAFTHIALISAAWNLNEAIEKGGCQI